MTTSTARRTRVRAPELRGRAWLNTGGRSYSIADFRGKVLLLDFWTFCCVNCLHVLDELRPLEHEFTDVLVTVGVHSPKFEHEADAAALADAVERYDVHHPVLDDPELTTWQQYAVRAWPTLVVVDPEGYIVHVAAGEGHEAALRRVITEVVAEHGQRGTLHRGDGPYVPPPSADTVLRFPSKATVTPSGTLLVANTARHTVVEFDGETVLRTIGTGRRGRADGLESEFSEPGGLALLPADIAASIGYDVVVADTVNHLLRGVRLSDGHVTTVAGTGAGWRDGATDGPATDIDLSSPWDVTWWAPAGGVVIAMAGNHTLGVFDPVAGTVSRFAGTTVEGLHDGPVAEAFFAQPSGLAADGDRLWLADAETSALRWISADGTEEPLAGSSIFTEEPLVGSSVDTEEPLAGSSVFAEEPIVGSSIFAVHTAAGTGLFDFGHRDGDASQALFQHPLGLTVLPDHSVVVADTYNGALRRYDPATNEVSTLATGIAEPSDVVMLDGEIVVVASAAHALERPVAPGIAARLVTGPAHQVTRQPTDLAADVTLAVVFQPPPGQKLDERSGPATRVQVTASPPELIRSGDGVSTDLSRRLTLNPDVGHGVLHVVARAASCDVGAEHAVCRLTRQDWGVPVRVVVGGASRLPLMLGGMDEE